MSLYSDSFGVSYNNVISVMSALGDMQPEAFKLSMKSEGTFIYVLESVYEANDILSIHDTIKKFFIKNISKAIYDAEMFYFTRNVANSNLEQVKLVVGDKKYFKSDDVPYFYDVIKEFYDIKDDDVLGIIHELLTVNRDLIYFTYKKQDIGKVLYFARIVLRYCSTW